MAKEEVLYTVYLNLPSNRGIVYRGKDYLGKSAVRVDKDTRNRLLADGKATLVPPSRRETETDTPTEETPGGKKTKN